MADTTPSTLARRFVAEQAAESQRQVDRLCAALRDLEDRCEALRARVADAAAVRDEWAAELERDA
jgi:hypothetical protein